MKRFDKLFTRRDFLRVSALALGTLAMRPWYQRLFFGRTSALPEFPQAERLGRVLDGKVEVKARPDQDSPTLMERFEDEIVIWLREVVGSRPMWTNQRYVETPEGFIYSPGLQPVLNQINEPHPLPSNREGIWVEVSVPYVDLVLDNPPPRSPWLKNTNLPRLYYSQIMWVDGIKTDEQGQSWYHVKERYGSYGDEFYAPTEAFRVIEEQEIAPINPNVEDKLVLVNVNYQTLSCLEAGKEVFFCRVSTGPRVATDTSAKKSWATPLGRHSIWRKLVSLHMTGGTTGAGWDIPGIGWTTLFSGQGMAVHSTFWHNSYGVPMSHGCVNANPEDAKWVFRWTVPTVPIEPGDVTHSGQGSTKVLVVEE